MEEKEINIYDYWLVIKKNRRLIILIFLVSIILAMIISLLMPKTYRATASILPPLETTKIGGLETLMSAAGINSIASQVSTADIFVGILKSNTMADEIIGKFNLQKLYQCKTRQDARKVLEKRTEIKVSKEKIISISILDRDPKMAADIANFYIFNLDRLNQNLNITAAGQMRKFIECRLEETKQILREAEEKLKSYQIGHKVLAEKDVQEAAMVTGQIQGRLIAARVELEAKKKYSTSENPDIIKLQNEVTEIEKALISIPPLETELARLIREFKTHETVYGLLIGQYEQAKIDEARDTPTVQVLDRASIPEKKYKPKISVNMAISGVMSLFLGVCVSFFKEHIREFVNEK